MKKQEQLQLLKKLVHSLPDAEGRRTQAASELLSALRKEMAIYLLPVLRSALRDPPESFVEKKALSTQLNMLLHEFGLGICHPAVKGVCGVNVGRNQNYPHSGWIRLADRKHQIRSAPTTQLDLDLLELVEAPPLVPGRHPVRE